MDDVTGVMDGYRECVRHLWNTHFRGDAEASQDWDLHEDFQEAARILFQALVLRKLNGKSSAAQRARMTSEKPLYFLKVDVDPRAAIMVNRGADTGYWDDPLTLVGKGELDMRFVQFFDWWELGFREFAFYRVRIVGSERHSYAIGRDALVQVGTSVRVLYDPSGWPVDP